MLGERSISQLDVTDSMAHMISDRLKVTSAPVESRSNNSLSLYGLANIRFHTWCKR